MNGDDVLNSLRALGYRGERKAFMIILKQEDRLHHLSLGEAQALAQAPGKHPFIISDYGRPNDIGIMDYFFPAQPELNLRVGEPGSMSHSILEIVLQYPEPPEIRYNSLVMSPAHAESLRRGLAWAIVQRESFDRYFQGGHSKPYEGLSNSEMNQALRLSGFRWHIIRLPNFGYWTDEAGDQLADPAEYGPATLDALAAAF